MAGSARIFRLRATSQIDDSRSEVRKGYWPEVQAPARSASHGIGLASDDLPGGRRTGQTHGQIEYHLTTRITVYTVHTQMDSAFVISQADKRPIYLQIMEQIRQRVAVGDWVAEQAIPSIRQLAVDIGVSVITVKRAYLELEREGIIVTHQGKGSFVSPDSEVGTRIREEELARHLDQAARSAALLGISQKDLEKRIRESYERVTDAEKESV